MQNKIFIAILFFLSVFSSKKIETVERNIGLLIRDDFAGEMQFAYRIQSACKNLNWQADILDINNPLPRKKNYDFIINLVPGNTPFHNCPHYLAIFHPLHHYFKTNGELKRGYANYDGYLLTYSPTPDDINFSKQKRPYMRWYPTIQFFPYQEVTPTYLFHFCCRWGNRFSDSKMKRLLSLLDQESFMRFYGHSSFANLYPKQYNSQIPFDSATVCNTIQSAGVTLIIHSNDHNQYGLPSGRIFEASASSSIIICDKNSFVEEHFGDSVLYIDTTKSAESISHEIKSHMEWILSHKEEALEKAKNGYMIYKKHFLLEDQLYQLGVFHDQITKNH